MPHQVLQVLAGALAVCRQRAAGGRGSSAGAGQQDRRESEVSWWPSGEAGEQQLQVAAAGDAGEGCAEEVQLHQQLRRHRGRDHSRQHLLHLRELLLLPEHPARGQELPQKNVNQFISY